MWLINHLTRVCHAIAVSGIVIRLSGFFLSTPVHLVHAGLAGNPALMGIIQETDLDLISCCLHDRVDVPMPMPELFTMASRSKKRLEEDLY